MTGKVTVLKAGGAWEILAVNDLAEESWATPAIAGSRIYIRTRSALYAFGESAAAGAARRFLVGDEAVEAGEGDLRDRRAERCQLR